MLRLLAGLVAAGLVWAGCSNPERSNPEDPQGNGGGTDDGIQIIAHLPEDAPLVGGLANVISQIRYQVSAADLDQPIEGQMDLIGRSARARGFGIKPGSARVFRVVALDITEVETFAAAATVEVEEDRPEMVELQLERLRGSLELTSELPPEIIELEVSIDAAGDTLLRRFQVTGPLTDPDSETTHNVVTRLPGQEGYSPLWVLQVFKLAAFDRVQDLASALDQSLNEENIVKLSQLLYLNAPIIGVGEIEGEEGS